MIQYHPSLLLLLLIINDVTFLGMVQYLDVDVDHDLVLIFSILDFVLNMYDTVIELGLV